MFASLKENVFVVQKGTFAQNVIMARMHWYPQSIMCNSMRCLQCFFFQAEDGIRDDLVTGVQTCALPISVLSKIVGALGGVDLLTNIDKTVQLTVEKELNLGITTYGAKAGTVIIMDPNSGAILGMASSPSFDPAKYWDYTNDDFKDAAISNTFEPGSIFKPITMAAALDAGVVKPDTQCSICDKPVEVNNYTIETWNNQYHSNSTMTSVIVNSDNVGMVFTGQKLGHDKFYDYLDKFGKDIRPE